MNADKTADSTNDSLRVFVYGTLKPGGRYWRRLCAGRVKGCFPAWIQGQLFDLPVGYPAVVASEDADAVVHGFVLRFAPAEGEEVLQDLDDLEGYDPTDPESPDNEYRRFPCLAYPRELTPEEQAFPKVRAYRMEDAPAAPRQCWAYFMQADVAASLRATPIGKPSWNHLES